MDSQYSDPAFDNLVLKEGNNICNDCLQLNPKWCSVNNGVFLCSLCARKHQNLNQKNSYVKSIEVDIWDKEEIFIIREGGNIRFNLTMEEYGIPLMSNPEYKYQNNASRYYRNLLKKEVRNSPMALEKPSIIQGILLIDRKSPIVYPAEIVEIINQQREEYINLNKGNNTFDDSIKSIENAFTEFKQNFQLAWDGINFKEKFDESSETAKKWAKNSKEYIVEKKNKVVESQIFQNIKVKTSESLNTIKDKTSQLMNNNRNNNPTNINQKEYDQSFENPWSY